MNGQNGREAAPTKTRVVIADIHAVVRQGICQELAHHADMEVVGETADGYETLALTSQHQPDVVILDIRLLGLDAVEVTRRLQKMSWSSPSGRSHAAAVLVFSAYNDKQYIWSLLAAGARGYLLKNEPLEQLVDGIRQVAGGQTILSQSVQTTVVEMIPRLNQELSDSEAKVLQLLAHGLSNREIAYELHITEGTVKAHLNNTYRKIPWIRTRAEAIAWAWINRLVPD
ncbi:MAG: response regulator transcription factor [Anaerolineae bacterium]|nr:response regulator transcription factor [Anaerolineae bacterium]